MNILSLTQCIPDITDFLSKVWSQIWDFLHWLHQEMEYWHWLLKWIGPLGWFLGTIFGLKYWDRRKVKKRMNRVDSRSTTLREVRAMVEIPGTEVWSCGTVRTKRGGIAVIQLKIKSANGKEDNKFFEIDPQNASILKGKVMAIDFEQEGFVIFWFDTKHGTVDCRVSVS